MQQYYYLNSANQQCGPIEPTAFAACGLTPDTMVWSEGMNDWTRISDIPELMRYLAPPVPVPGYAPGSYSQNAPFSKPDSNLVWAILSTILCCIPTGVYAIICASKVDGLWNQGFFDEAKRMSRQAWVWSLVGAGVNVVFMIVYIAFIVIAAVIP